MKKIQILAIAVLLVAMPALTSCKSKKEKDATTEERITTPDVTPVETTVTNATDEELNNGLRDALKDHPTVNYSVNNGKIVLTGEIAKDKWINVKQTLDKLVSKGYDMSGLTIK